MFTLSIPTHNQLLFSVKRFILLLLTTVSTGVLLAQTDLKVGTTPGSISPSAVFEAASTTKGLLIPRVTTLQMNAIASPILGLMVFNTDLNCLHFYFGGWKSQCDPANLGAWSLLGNSNTTAGTHFIGTTNAQDLVFKANNTEGVRLSSSGFVGIGNIAPSYKLDIVGANPVRLIGLNAGAITDSIVSSNNGILRRLSIADIVAAGSNAWSLLGNGGSTGANFIGTTDLQDLTFKTNGATRLTLSSIGAVTQTGAGQVTFTGNVDATNGLDVTNAALTANAGSTLTGTTNINATGASATNIGNATSATTVLGATTINTSGTAATTIGNATSAVTVAGTTGITGATSINTSGSAVSNIGTGTSTGTVTVGNTSNIVSIASDDVQLPNLPAYTTGNNILALNASNQVELRSFDLNTLAWQLGGNTLTGTQTIGSNSLHDVGIETNGTTRLTISSTGTIAQTGANQVTFTGNIDATNGLDVTTAALTANAGSTLTGTTNINATGATATNIGNSGSATTVLGATTINTSGTAATSIGNSGSAVTVAGTTSVTGATTINTTGALTTSIGNSGSAVTIAGTTDVTGATTINTSGTAATTIGNASSTVNIPSTTVQMANLPVYTAGNSFLTLNASNQVEKRTISNILTGTGTATRVAFWGTSSTLSSNADLYWDNTNSRLGIGGATTSPQYKLDIDAMTGITGNPLRLLGLNAGATTDSILTSASGVVRRMSLNSLGWGLTGNSGTTAGTSFVGTTDAQDLVFKTNSAERMRVTSTGIGIGVTVPAYKLDIVGSNPVRLIGLNAGATTDSVVTSNGGILQRLSIAQVVGTSGWLLDGNTLTGTTTIGSNSAHDVGIETNGTTRLTVSSTGTITQTGANQVTFTGNVDATNGLDVTTAALTANAGSTLTGTTNINATGASATNIGNATSATTVVGATTINTTGAAATSIGNSGSTVTVAGTTGITGATSINTSGATATSIGNATSATTVVGATTINTTGAAATSIGNSGSTVTVAGTTGITGATSINTSGSAVTNIGTGTSTGTVTVGNAANTTTLASPTIQLTNIPSGTSTTFLTLNGSNVESKAVANIVTGTGTATRVAFWNSSSALSSNANLFWDNTNSRLGIGVTSPAYKLDVDALTASAGNPLRLQGLLAGATTDSILTSSGGVVRRMSMNNMAWGLTGNSGTTAGTNFVGTTDNVSLTFKTNSIRSGYLGTSTDNNVFLGVSAGATISSGTTNTLIGATSDVSTGTLTNATALGYGATVDASNKMRLGNTSVTLVETYGTFVTVSDRRLKTNISDNNIGLNFIKAVRPVKYELIAQKGMLYDGFIAQEIDSILQKQNIKTFSGLSKPKNDLEHYSVSYATFVVPLVNAVKELDAKNEQLATENEQLKAELAKMKAANMTLKASVEKNSQDIETIKAMLDKK